jgi:hypothetical protein
MENQLQQSAQGFGEHEYRRRGTLVFHYWECWKQSTRNLEFAARLELGDSKSCGSASALLGAPSKHDDNRSRLLT